MPSTQRLEAYHFYEDEWDDIEQLREAFEWEIPEEFNIASYVCDRWAGDDRTCVYAEDADGTRRTLTYADIQNRANRLANFLEAQGIGRGDRVAVSIQPSPEVLIGHIAAWKLGAISVPLSTLFGPDAMEYRLQDCGVAACLTGPTTLDVIREVRSGLSNLETLVVVDGESRAGESGYDRIQSEYAPAFETVQTDPDDDACIVYTSGTTGDPKGVLHAHRFLLGMLPIEARLFVEEGSTEGDVWWLPGDWSWIGSTQVIFPAMFYGISLVANKGGAFDPETAFELIDRYDITFFGAPPTALRMMMNVDNVSERFDVESVINIGSGGEPMEQSTIEWADEIFDGAAVQEGYGQTECITFIGDYYPVTPSRRDRLGVAIPGHEVAILDQETREPVEPGEIGEIAVRCDGDPGSFKKYWNKPEKTEAKFHGDWLLTEDLGTVDEDGYFSFESRADDMILTSGYKVSPVEIENTLGDHEAVIAAGVIGVPHDERGEIPKAYVSIHEDVEPSAELRTELQQYVKDTLAKYEYPRELEFVEELPTTATGKVSRHDLRVRAGLETE
jgi:acetyl-CoA synthetase